MKKLLAVIKREYLARVRAKMFLVSTLLLPLVMSLFGVVPALILNLDAGSLVRVAVVDHTGKIYPELQETLAREEADPQEPNDPMTSASRFSRRGAGNFQLEEVNVTGRSNEDIQVELAQRLRARELDSYIILPPDFLDHGEAEFFNRNPGDVMSRRLAEATPPRQLPLGA